MLNMKFTRLNVSLLGHLANNVIDTVRKNSNKDVQTEYLFLKLVEVADRYDSVLMTAKFTKMGKELKQLLQNMKSRHFVFVNMLKAASTLDDDRSAKAKSLLAVIKRFGKVSHDNSSEARSRISRLINDLSTDEYLAMIDAVDARDYFELLKEAHKKFHNTHAEKMRLENELRRIDRPSSMRSELEDALRGFLTYVWLLHEKEEWFDLYSDLRVVIKWHSSIRRRTGGGEKEEEKNEEEAVRE